MEQPPQPEYIDPDAQRLAELHLQFDPRSARQALLAETAARILAPALAELETEQAALDEKLHG